MEGFTYQDVFKMLILLIVAAGGAPITQLIKAGLAALFKRPIEDRLALFITGVVAAGIAVLEMFLSGVLQLDLITLENFPSAFFAVFTVATIYYKLLIGSEGFFGKGFILRPSSG